MFKLTKFSICIVGITIIGALPFMGLTCRGVLELIQEEKTTNSY
jgi:hypothetical protein